MKFLKRTHGVSKLGKEDMTSLYNMATEQETLPVQADQKSKLFATTTKTF